MIDRRRKCLVSASLLGLAGLSVACGIDSSGLSSGDGGGGGGPDVVARDVPVGRDSGRDATQKDARPSEDVAHGNDARGSHDAGVDSNGEHADSGMHGHADAGVDAGVDAGRPPRDAGSAEDASDACTMYCNPPDAIVTDTPTTVCVSGGCDSAQDLACPTGQAVVGVTGSEFNNGNAMAKLAAVCGTIGVGGPSAFAVRTTVTMSTSSIGQGGATAIAGNCPSGSAVSGFSESLGAAGAVYQFTIDCSAIAVDYTAPGTYGITVGTASPMVIGGGTGITPASAACASGQVASGLQVAQETIGGQSPVTVPRPYGLDCSNLSFP